MIDCLGKDTRIEKQRKDMNPDDLTRESVLNHYAYHFTCGQKKTWNLSTISIMILLSSKSLFSLKSKTKKQNTIESQRLYNLHKITKEINDTTCPRN